MNSKSRFREVMARPGENDSVDDDLCRTFREFISTLCGGGRAKDVNALRFNKLTVKHKISMWTYQPYRLANPL